MVIINVLFELCCSDSVSILQILLLNISAPPGPTQMQINGEKAENVKNVLLRAMFINSKLKLRTATFYIIKLLTITFSLRMIIHLFILT